MLQWTHGGLPVASEDIAEWNAVNAESAAKNADILEWEAANNTPTSYAIPSYADAFSSRDTILGGLKGIAKAGTDVLLAPADLAYRGGNYLLDAITGNQTNLEGGYPSDRFSQVLNSISGGEGSDTAEAITRGVGNLVTALAIPSQAAKIPQSASLITKTLGFGGEGAAYNLLADPKTESPVQDALLGAGVGMAVPAVGAGIGKGMDFLMPERTATKTAQGLADELRKIVPSFGTDDISMADRALGIGTSLEAKGQAAKKEASALFDALGSEPVVLDDAIKNIQTFANEVSGPVAPGGRTEGLINALTALKPQDKIINTPASSILDEFGKPMREAITEIIPGGPATVPLNKLQDTLRDVGKLYRGAEGVDRAVLGRAQSELLDAAESQLSGKSLSDLQGARSAWRNMKQTFEEGGVGKIREAIKDVEGRYETLKNTLFNDSKAAKQIASQLDPQELESVQNLMLNEVLRMQPVSWERKLTEKYDSFKAIFGKEATENMLTTFSRDGTIGKKLLQDNNGIKSVLGKFIAKPLIAGTVGYEFGGKEGAAIGVLGALRSGNQQKALNSAKSLIMRAAAGSEDALNILNTPIKSANYGKAISKLGAMIPNLLSRSQPSTEEGPSDTRIESEASLNSNPNTFIDQTINKAENMIDNKPPKPEIVSAKRVEAEAIEPLVEAVIGQESGGRANAVSPKGALGLMQVMPATAKDIAKELGVDDYDLKDPETNRLFGTYYLNKLINKFGDVKLALAAYNGGMGRVERLLKKTKGSTFDDIKDFLPEETAKYVPGVLKRIKKPGSIKV